MKGKCPNILPVHLGNASLPTKFLQICPLVPREDALVLGSGYAFVNFSHFISDTNSPFILGPEWMWTAEYVSACTRGVEYNLGLIDSNPGIWPATNAMSPGQVRQRRSLLLRPPHIARTIRQSVLRVQSK